MIKKTIQTIKENPVILLILFIPFVYSVIDTLLQSNIKFLPNPMVWAESLNQPGVVFSSIFSFVYTIGFAIFLYPAIRRYIFLAVNDEPREKWYKKCFKDFWWRRIVLGFIVGILYMIILIPIIIIGAILTFAADFMISPAITYIVMGIIFLLLGTVDMIANAAIFAEDDFSKGLSNIFKAWKKTFSKLLPVVLISLIPTAITFAAVFASEGGELNNVISIVLSFFTVAVSIFTAVYSMHLYVDYKAKNPDPDFIEPGQSEESDEVQAEG